MQNRNILVPDDVTGLLREPRHGGPVLRERKIGEWRGVSAEYTILEERGEYNFKFSGSSHLLVAHDMKRVGGETRIDTRAPVRNLDLRNTLTFVPAGHEVSGWSKMAHRENSITALYFDPAMVPAELDAAFPARDEQPMVYFSSATLLGTLAKLRTLLENPSPVDGLYAETLGLTATIELDRLRRDGASDATPREQHLSAAQEKRVIDYIAANLGETISLHDLADLVGLTRLHFTRLFKATIGVSPHQYMVQGRVEQAKGLLLGGQLPMGEIARRLGFGSQAQLSESFRREMGVTPTQFRQAHR